MAVIDIGPGATNRDADWPAGYTIIDYANSANATGVLDTFEVWAATDIAGFKIGPFTVTGGPTGTSGDFESIGNVTSGSKQTFTGKTCDVTSGTYLGVHWDTGAMEVGTGGVSLLYVGAVDYFDGAPHSFAGESGYTTSIYATGETSGPVMPIFMHHYMNNAG